MDAHNICNIQQAAQLDVGIIILCKTKIDLGTKNLGYEGAKAIGETMKVNTSLTEINLNVNNIGAEGGKANRRG